MCQRMGIVADSRNPIVLSKAIETWQEDYLTPLDLLTKIGSDETVG